MRGFQAEDTHQGNYNLSGELDFFFPFLPDFHGNPFSLVGEQTRTRGQIPPEALVTRLGSCFHHDPGHTI